MLNVIGKEYAFRKSEFWKNLEVFLSKCECDETNDELRHKILIDMDIFMRLEKSHNKEYKMEQLKKKLLLIEENEDDIKTSEKEFRPYGFGAIMNSVSRYLETDNTYILYYMEVFNEKPNILNNSKLVRDNSESNNFILNKQELSQNNHDSVPQLINDQHFINRNQKDLNDYIDISPILKEFKNPPQLIDVKDLTSSNEINNQQYSINSQLKQYLYYNIFTHVQFSDIHKFLFKPNGILHDYFMENRQNRLNDYTPAFPYLIKIKSRFDQIKILLTLENNLPYILLWILSSFELSDHTYRLNLPPHLIVKSQFQRQCLIAGIINIAKKKTNAIVKNQKCSIKLYKAVFFLMIYITVFVNQYKNPIKHLGSLAFS